MAPVKFEENIKEKLEKRSLKPSKNAWQSLEQKLNADKAEQNKKRFWWLGIAASFIGLLLVVQQYVNINSTNDVVLPVVVQSENDTIINPVKSSLTSKKSQKFVQEQLKETPIKKQQNRLTTNNTVANNKKEKQNLVVTVAVTPKENETPKSSIMFKDDIVTSVVNTIDNSANKESQITTLETSESEIEALLKAANKNIQLKNKNNVSSISIDANALLKDVETEMPPTLRGQLFKVIEKNFKTAKTVVATRNE